MKNFNFITVETEINMVTSFQISEFKYKISVLYKSLQNAWFKIIIPMERKLYRAKPYFKHFKQREIRIKLKYSLLGKPGGKQKKRGENKQGQT